jgi:protein required for attachment to host cells
MKTWIVVAGRTEAKIFEYGHKKTSVVQYVTQLENPRGRLRPIAINADKPGSFASLQTHGTKLVKEQSPTERIAQEFAIKVADFLDGEKSGKKFDELILIADPHFMGRLRPLLSKELKQALVKEVIKDLGGITTQELQNRLWPVTSVSL